MNIPTKKQIKTLHYILKYQKKNGHCPTFDEIAAYFKITFPAVQQRITGMIKKGMMTRDDKPYNGGLYRGVV